VDLELSKEKAPDDTGALTFVRRLDRRSGILLRTFLQGLHYLIHVKAGRLLPLRIVPERRQELAHKVLRGNQ
jgi:hypothetical protein